MNFNFIDWFQRGGLVMYPIALGSLVGSGVFVERYIYLKTSHINVEKFMYKIRTLLKGNNIDQAIQLSGTTSGPVSRVIRAGLLMFKEKNTTR